VKIKTSGNNRIKGNLQFPIFSLRENIFYSHIPRFHPNLNFHSKALK